MLFRAFSKSIGGKFNRIQFTPDLMPSDLTGINFYNMKESEFEFRPGPLFSNFVLADEINRATARTQSAGTFALPEAQLDRFMMRLSLGYMAREDEMSVISNAN